MYSACVAKLPVRENGFGFAGCIGVPFQPVLTEVGSVFDALIRYRGGDAHWQEVAFLAEKFRDISHFRP